MKDLKENQNHLKSSQRPRKWGSQALIALVTVIVSLTVVGAAFAFTVGNIDGTWGWIDGVTETSSTSSNGGGAECSRWATGPGDSPTSTSNWNPAIQTGSNSDENQVRYGRDAYQSGGQWYGRSCSNTSFGEQSGFGFDGYNGPVSPAANIPFYLGKFTHYNNAVYSTDDNGNNPNPFNWVDLTVTVPVTCNDGTTSTNFSFVPHFTLDETSNTAGTCVYPGTSVCPDKVTVTQPSASSFTCPDGDYTVNILGFTKTGLNGQTCDLSYNSAAVATEYITEENQDNIACLWAEISPPRADVTPEKTCANFYTEDPVYTIVTTNLGPGSARQVKIVDVIPAEAGIDAPLVYSSQLTTTLGGTVNQGACSVSGQTVTCELLTSLPAMTYDPAAKWTVTLHVFSTVSNPTTVTNSVTASTVTTDVNSLNNTDTCSSEAPTGITVLPPVAAAVGQTIQVDWTSTSEVEILGFNLYRSTTLDGPRSLVYPVQAKHPGKQIGDSYQYIDADVQPGGVYYYWLEVRLKDGSTQVMEPASASLPEVAIKFYLPTIRR